MRRIVSPLSGIISPLGLRDGVSIYAILRLEPDLVFDFANEFYRTRNRRATFSEAITYTGASNKTMVDSDGLLKWAPHNLLLRSEDFSVSPWTKEAGGTGSVPVITGNSAVAPDGSLTASTIAFDVGAGSSASDFSGVFQDDGGPAARVSSGVWLKSDANVTVRMSIPGVSVADATVAVTSSWQFFLLSGVPSVPSITGLRLRARGDLTNGSFNVYAWGAHMFRSDLGGMVSVPEDARATPSATTYVPTTSVARYLPRRGHHVYNGSAWVNEGLLVESEARTNLITYSSEFDNAYWTKAGATITANDGTAPDGTTTADKLVEDLTSGGHRVSFASAVTSGTTYTTSVYVKQAGRIWIRIAYSTGFSVSSTWFDIDSGTVGTVGAASATIEDAGDGWYRISATQAATSSTTGLVFITMETSGSGTSYTGDGTSGVYFYGAQFEAGSVPSSYIPTSGSTVTRAAETLTVAAADLPYPTPRVIGPELVTNGDFATASDWVLVDSTISSSALSVNAVSAVVTARGNSVALATGKVCIVQFEIVSHTSGSIRSEYRGINSTYFAAPGVYTTVGVVSAAGAIQLRTGAGGFVGTIDNVSVREIDPLSVSIQMQGKLNYSDEGAAAQQTFLRWQLDANNYILWDLDTDSTATGEVNFNQAAASVVDTVASSGTALAPSVATPFNIAGRHGSTFINGAIAGTALTADTTPVALAALSSTNMTLAHDMMGTLKLVRMWDQDLGDTGIAAASAPSLEPSLSLLFDGSGNSFTVEDWSE